MTQNSLTAMSNNELQVLLKEYELHRHELHLRFDHRLKGLTFLLTVAFTAFGLAVKDKVGEIFILFPWFLNATGSYMAHQLMVGTFTRTYIEDIERRIKVLDYQRYLEYQIFRRPSFLRNPYELLSALTVIPFLGGYVYCLYEGILWFQDKGTGLAFIYGFVTFLYGIVVFFVAVRGISKCSKLPNSKRPLSEDSDSKMPLTN